MPYKFATLQQDHSDLASGRVLYSLPGHPAFPIRLASEIFQRCLAKRAISDIAQPQIVYDPCCGSAYHLTTLAYAHWPAIHEIIGSDVDAQAIQVAARNLALLTPEGLDRRAQELAAHYHAYGKEAHQAALRSAKVLGEQVATLTKQHPIRTRVFQASALDAKALSSQLGDTRADIVLTDVPYGRRSEWQIGDQDLGQNPVGAMLQSLRGILHTRSIVAVITAKHQKIAEGGYERVERFQMGKRQILLLKPQL